MEGKNNQEPRGATGSPGADNFSSNSPPPTNFNSRGNDGGCIVSGNDSDDDDSHQYNACDYVHYWCYKISSSVKRKPIIFWFTALSALFSLLSVADCSFMITTTVVAGEYNSENGYNPDYYYKTTKIGLFSQMVYDLDGQRLGCVDIKAMMEAEYNHNNKVDGLFRAGRAFGVLTCMFILTTLLMIGYSLLLLPKCTNKLWTASQYLYMITTVTQMFTFFGLGSTFACGSEQQNCQLTGVGILAAFNVILLACLSIIAYVEPPPTNSWLISWQVFQDMTRKATLRRINPQVSEFLSEQQQRRLRKHEEQQQQYQQQLESQQHPLRGPPQEAFDVSGVNIHELTSPDSNDYSTDDDDLLVDKHTLPISTLSSLNSRTSFRWGLIACFTAAWVVCIAGVERCSLVLVGPVGGTKSDYSGIGLFKRAVYSNREVVGCVEYPDTTKEEFDQVFSASRVFASVAAMLITVIWILTTTQLFINVAKEEIWFVIRVLLPVTAIFQMLVFFVFKTETCVDNDLVECVPGPLGIWVILNVMLMVTMSVLVCIIPPPPHPLCVRHHFDDNDDNDSRVEMKRYLSSNLYQGSTVQYQRRRQHHHQQHHRYGGLQQQQAVTGHQSALMKPETTETKPIDDDEWTAKESQFAADDSNMAVLSIDPPPKTQLPPPPTVEEPEGPADLITVTVEFSGREKKTIKTLTYPDGSKTITTSIEEISEEEFSQREEEQNLQDVDINKQQEVDEDKGSDVHYSADAEDEGNDDDEMIALY